MFTKFIQFFYPDIQRKEIKKMSLLALSFVFTVGTYWLMRLLKDIVLYKLAFPVSLGWSNDTGRQWIPTLKTLSPIFIFILVLIYSKLVDIFEKHKIIYIIASFYMFLFSCITGILLIKNTYGDAYLGTYTLATSGILGYLFTESFGSLMVAVFWSFTISSTTNAQAKRGFPFIIAAGQLGSIIGSSLFLIKTNIIWPFYAMVVFFLGLLILTVRYLIRTIPNSEMTSDIKEKKTKPDMFEGFKLLGKKPYLIGVLVVSTFYEVATIIVEYQMNSQANAIFDDVAFKWFKGIYGISVNTLAFLMALLGTSYIIKKLGTRLCLLIYPITFALAIIALYGYYIHSPSSWHLMWGTFLVMITIKAASYAINNPVKEMMYIPTSKNAKFKTKSIIDMFGSRATKMGGAQVTRALNVADNFALSLQNLMIYGSLISLGFIGIWFIAAIYVGNKNKQLVDNGEIIE